MADPTLRQCACLAAIAASGSFRRAADRLGLSQPALSAQIRALEAALGVTLVERRSSGAALTLVGRDILGHAERMLDCARALDEAAAAARGATAGRLRLGVSPTIGPYLMPGIAGRLAHSAPGLALAVREGPPLELRRGLLEGAHDAALLHLPENDTGLVTEELFRERLLLMLAADHPLAARAAVEPTDLEGLEVLTLDPRFQMHDQVAALCETFGARLSDAYEAATLDSLRRMTGAGLGAAFAPELYVRAELAEGGPVVARPVRGRALHRLIGLAWRRSSPDARALSLIAQAARDAFAEAVARTRAA